MNSKPEVESVSEMWKVRKGIEVMRGRGSGRKVKREIEGLL